MQINPISEMKTELVMANVLSQEIKQKTSRLSKMRENLNEYHERQSTIPAQNKPVTKAQANKINDYDMREKIIVDWAKTHYQDIQSINQFPYNQHALKPKITPGAVYLCLKNILLLNKMKLPNIA